MSPPSGKSGRRHLHHGSRVCPHGRRGGSERYHCSPVEHGCPEDSRPDRTHLGLRGESRGLMVHHRKSRVETRIQRGYAGSSCQRSRCYHHHQLSNARIRIGLGGTLPLEEFPPRNPPHIVSPRGVAQNAGGVGIRSLQAGFPSCLFAG